MLYKLLLIGVGGAAGSVLRYLVGGWVQQLTTETFPTGTLFVNVSGCLAIGFLGTYLTESLLVREEYRVAILVGLLGGYTTFSAFGRESLALAGDNQFWGAALNILASNAAGLGAVWLGHRLAQRLGGVPS